MDVFTGRWGDEFREDLQSQKEGKRCQGERKRAYPSNAVLLGVLLLQTILFQSLHHSKVSRVSRGEEDGLIWDVGLQTVGVYPQSASCGEKSSLFHEWVYFMKKAGASTEGTDTSHPVRLWINSLKNSLSLAVNLLTTNISISNMVTSDVL